jgi:threonine/homoserine/homoserine lactone efflux protein
MLGIIIFLAVAVFFSLCLGIAAPDLLFWIWEWVPCIFLLYGAYKAWKDNEITKTVFFIVFAILYVIFVQTEGFSL